MYESWGVFLSSGTHRIRWPSQSLLSQIYQIFWSIYLQKSETCHYCWLCSSHSWSFTFFVQELSKSLDLYRPIASVYREKPTANTGVASRDLPLLLLVFTKGSLLTFKGGQSVKKSLTCKTVAMALEVYSGTLAPSNTSLIGRRLQFLPPTYLFSKHPLASIGLDWLQWSLQL